MSASQSQGAGEGVSTPSAAPPPAPPSSSSNTNRGRGRRSRSNDSSTGNVIEGEGGGNGNRRRRGGGCGGVEGEAGERGARGGRLVERGDEGGREGRGRGRRRGRGAGRKGVPVILLRAGAGGGAARGGGGGGGAAAAATAVAAAAGGGEGAGAGATGVAAVAGVAATAGGQRLVALASRPRQEIDHDEGDGGRPCCVICTEHLDQGKHRPAVGPCDHAGTCALCFMRLRLLVKNMGCPLCKTPLEQVYVFDGPLSLVRPYASLNIWGTACGPGYVHDEKAGMFMPRGFYQQVFVPIQSFRCCDGEAERKRGGGCGYEGKNVQGLGAHLREKHDLHLCDVCVEHKQVFVGEQTRHRGRKALAAHMEKGEAVEGFAGHPRCKFCRNKPFYDSSALFLHLRTEHYSCHVCERIQQQEQQQPQHRYYRDYHSLEKHFRREHHLCEDPLCLSQRFVVFPHAIDLHAHTRAAHPGRKGLPRGLDLHASVFRVRGQQGWREGQQEGQEEKDEGEEWTPTRYLPSAGRGREVGGGEGRRSHAAVTVDPTAFPALSADPAAASASQVGMSRAPAQQQQQQQQASSRWGIEGGRREGVGFPLLGPPPSIASASTRPPPPPLPVRSLPLQRALQQLHVSPPTTTGGRERGSEGGGGTMLARNRRFAEALGIAAEVQGQAAALAHVRGEGGREGEVGVDAWELELERPVYPRELLAWAMSNVTRMDVVRLEKKIEEFLRDGKEASLYLKPMGRDERRRVHLLAEFYGLQSVSYDNEPRRFVALIKTGGVHAFAKAAIAATAANAPTAANAAASAPGHRAPLVLLSEAAAAETLAGRSSCIAAITPSSSSSSTRFTAAHPPPTTSTTSSSSASLLVTNIGEASGKVVTDRLRLLCPSLPLLGYHSREPPSEYAEPSPPALVVSLASLQSLATLLDEARARPQVLFPFVLKATLGGVVVVVKPVTPSAECQQQQRLQQQAQGEQQQQQQQQQRPKWGTSVLAGKLKPRTLPLPSSLAPSSSSSSHVVAETRPTTIASLLASSSGKQAMKEQQKLDKSQAKLTKQGGKKRGGGRTRGGENVDELRPGQAIASNRWAGLVNEEDEDEDEEGREGKREGERGEVQDKAPLGKQLHRDEEEEEEEEEDDDEEEEEEKEARKAHIVAYNYGEEEEEEEEKEDEDEEEEEGEEEEEELEVSCPACTYKHLSDFCPMCMTPRPTTMRM